MNGHHLVRGLALVSGLSASGMAMAQQPPTVTLGPVQAVPALSTGLLLALAGMLALVGLRLLRDRTLPRGLNQVILAAGSITLAAGALVTVHDARALVPISPSVVLVESEQGGQVTLPFGPGPNSWQVVNDTAVSLQIKAIDPGSCIAPLQMNGGAVVALPPGASPVGDCAVGKTLGSSQYCTLELECGIALNAAQPL